MLSKKLAKNSNIAVIGAGISGLSFTYFLSKLRPDIDITVYEKSGRTGGWINSHKVPIITKTQLGFEKQPKSLIFEKGPRTLRGVSDGSVMIVDILKALGHEDKIMCMEKSSVANKKYLLDGMDLVQVPSDTSSLFKFISSNLGAGLISSLIKEPFQKPSKDKKDETIESYINRRFGSPVLDNILSAVIHGIYAGDVSKLSVKSILPKLVELESKHDSVVKAGIHNLVERFKNRKIEQVPELSNTMKVYQSLMSSSSLLELSQNLKKYPMIALSTGLATLTDSITKYLETKPNIHFKYNQEIEAIQKSDSQLSLRASYNQNSLTHTSTTQFNHIRSTINSHELSKVFECTENTQILREILSSLNYVSIFLCNVYIPHDVLSSNGFGFLVPRKNKNPENLLGVIFDSDIEKYSKVFAGAGSPASSKKNENYTKVTLMIGGHYFMDSGMPSPSINLLAVKKILKDYLKFDTANHNLVVENGKFDSKPIVINDNDILISYSIIENCIPQFEVGYSDLMRSAERELEKSFNGLVSVGGMSFGNGVGVPDVVVNSFEAAVKLA